MKTVICFAIITLVIGIQGLTEEQKAKRDKWSNECKKETGASQELIDKAINEAIFTDDEKLKKQILCVSKKAGTMSEDGELQIDVIKTKLRENVENTEHVDEIVNKCAVKRDTPEETAFQSLKCIRENKSKFSLTN